jgi:hypothetical protein
MLVGLGGFHYVMSYGNTIRVVISYDPRTEKFGSIFLRLGTGR